MLFSIASVFPDVSNWPCFHPLHCLPPTFPPFLSNGALYDSDSPVRTDSGLLILFWTDFSLGLLHTQLGSLDSLSSGLMFLIPGSHVYLSLRYPLLFSIIIQTHQPFFFPATHSQVAFWKVWWRVKAAVNMGWGVGVVGLSPASPWPPSHLAPALGLRPADRSSLLWTRSLFLSLYCAPLYSAITSPSSESWRLWSPVAPMLVFISSRGRRGRLWVLEPSEEVGIQSTKGKTSDLGQVRYHLWVSFLICKYWYNVHISKVNEMKYELSLVKFYGK